MGVIDPVDYCVCCITRYTLKYLIEQGSSETRSVYVIKVGKRELGHMWLDNNYLRTMWLRTKKYFESESRHKMK